MPGSRTSEAMPHWTGDFSYTFAAMAIVETHKPGGFCWIELGTTDQEAAKKFYGSLFGWVASDMPMGPGEAYTIFKLQGRDAAAGYTLRPDQKAMGVPPHWMPYVAVSSVDASAKRATELGGRVLMGPFDVGASGRMAVLQDPTGAVICIWQAKEHPGIGIVGVDGTLCWADLNTSDVPRAGKFYSDLFGWKITADTDDDPPTGYLHIQNGEDFIGGIPPAEHRDPKIPSHWLAYFLVSDCDASAAKAKELGGSFCLPPMTMEGVGRFAVVMDPQRASFAIFQPLPRK